jgi:hypothetical protein
MWIPQQISCGIHMIMVRAVIAGHRNPLAAYDLLGTDRRSP